MATKLPKPTKRSAETPKTELDASAELDETEEAEEAAEPDPDPEPDPEPEPKTELDASAEAEPIRYYRVTEHSRYFVSGAPHNMPKGHVIDSMNYNIADVKDQGIPLADATAADIDKTPGLGHRST